MLLICLGIAIFLTLMYLSVLAAWLVDHIHKTESSHHNRILLVFATIVSLMWVAVFKLLI